MEAENIIMTGYKQNNKNMFQQNKTEHCLYIKLKSIREAPHAWSKK